MDIDAVLDMLLAAGIPGTLIYVIIKGFKTYLPALIKYRKEKQEEKNLAEAERRAMVKSFTSLLESIRDSYMLHDKRSAIILEEVNKLKGRIRGEG